MRHRMRVRMILIISPLWLSMAVAQPGLVRDDFSDGSSRGWGNATDTFPVVQGKLMVPTGPASPDRWGSFRKRQGFTISAGTYPIFAVRMKKPPKCNIFFDTPLGSYNGTNNNLSKIALADSGNVYYVDLSRGSLGNTALALTSATTLGFVEYKIAEIELTSTQLANSDTAYPVYWIRTYQSLDSLRKAVQPQWFSRTLHTHPAPFVHPGLLHDSTDFARMKRLVAGKIARPWGSYQKLLADGRSVASYSMRGPYSQITRDAASTIDGTGGGTIHANVESDVMAAYYNALLWKLTDDAAHAAKAMEILDGYAAKTTGVVGADAALNGLYGFMLANAAEILSMPGSGWPPEKRSACLNMLKNVFYPVCGEFAPCAHGNWDIICMKCLMSIAIVCDDHAIYDRVLNYYYYGEGNGSIGNYVVNDSGQLEESNRDQPHTMLALGGLAELAEIALKQGDDLYVANNNAIRRGYEYTARYNLGTDVPYQLHYDFCERNFKDYTPEAVSTEGRGNFRSVFEIAWNHYAMVQQTPMPWTRKVLDSIGPEGAPFGADNPGYGSLLFYRDVSDVSISSSRFRHTTPPVNAGWKLQDGFLHLQGITPGTPVEAFNLGGRKLAQRVFMEETGALYVGKNAAPFVLRIGSRGFLLAIIGR